MIAAKWHSRLRAQFELSAGQRKLKSGEVQAAVERFKQAAHHAGPHADLKRQAHDRAANVLLSTERLVDSLRHLRALADLSPADPAAWRRLAEVLDRAGDRDGCIDAWGEVLSQGGDELDVRERLLGLLWNCDRKPEALVHARALAEAAGPRQSEPWRRLAKLLTQSNRPEEAVEAEGRALAIEPGDAAGHERIVHLLETLDRRAETVAHVRALAELSPENAKSWARLARLLGDEGDVGGAIEAWRRAIRSAPTDLALRREPLQFLDGLGRSADMIPHLHALAPDAGEDPGLLKRLGRAYEAIGQAHDALAAWRKAAEVSPADQGAHEAAARLMDQLGLRAEAVFHLQAVARLRPEKLKPQRHLAVRLSELGQIEAAASAWRRVLALEPGAVEAHQALVELLQALGRGAEAVDHARALTEYAPKDSKAWSGLARLLQAHGDAKGAVDAWRRARKYTVGDLEPDIRLADLLVGLGRPFDAVPHLRNIAAATPEKPEGWKRLAGALEAVGEIGDAIGAWRSAVTSAPRDLEPHEALVRLLDAQNDRAGAVKHLQAIADLTPHHGEAQKAFARRLQELGKAKAAVLVWRRALLAQSDDLETHSALASLHLELGAPAAAAPHLRAVAEGAPRDAANAWRRLARVLETLGDSAGELEAWARVIVASPDDAAAHARAAELLQDCSRHAEALPHLYAAAEAQPHVLKAWRRLARALHTTGETEQEIEAWRHVLSISRDDGEAHQRLADVLTSLHLWGQATPHLRALAESAPDKSKLWKRVARAVQKAEPPEAAIAAWRQVVALEPDDLESHEQLARLLGRLGRKAEMIEHLRRLADAAPQRLELWRRLAPSGAESEAELEREINWWRLVLEIAPDDHETRERLALFLSGVGRYREALPHFKSLAETGPDSWIRWKRLARCAAELNEAGIAVQAWKQVLLIRGDDVEAAQRLAAAEWLEDGPATAKPPPARARRKARENMTN